MASNMEKHTKNHKMDPVTSVDSCKAFTKSKQWMGTELAGEVVTAIFVTSHILSGHASSIDSKNLYIILTIYVVTVEISRRYYFRSERLVKLHLLESGCSVANNSSTTRQRKCLWTGDWEIFWFDPALVDTEADKCSGNFRSGSVFFVFFFAVSVSMNRIYVLLEVLCELEPLQTFLARRFVKSTSAQHDFRKVGVCSVVIVYRKWHRRATLQQWKCNWSRNVSSGSITLPIYLSIMSRIPRYIAEVPDQIADGSNIQQIIKRESYKEAR